MTNYSSPKGRILTNFLSRLGYGCGRLRTPVLILAALLPTVANQPLRGREWIVDRNHPHCSDQGPGTTLLPLQTINRAAQSAQPGDTVVVHAGEYRERVAPARGGTPGRPIVYRAATGARVVIKGSERWQPKWERQDATRAVYLGSLDDALFAGALVHPYRTRLEPAPAGKRLTLGQVFVDGHPLREVDRDAELLKTPGSWKVNEDSTGIHVHFPDAELAPSDRVVELTVRDRIFAPHRRGLGYIHVRGFVMEHCANQFPDRFWQSDSPQAGALGCRAGNNWVIEHNTIRYAKSIGIDCGYEGKRDLEGRQPTPQNTGHHIIRNNTISDNGCCGIAGMRSHSTQIVGNIIERNNTLKHTAPEIGGIKVHHFIGGRIEGNLIRQNLAHGVWIDNIYRQARVTRNVVVANHGNGIFVELGQGPLLVDNNIVAGTRGGYHPRDARGDGLYSHDASGITFAHNLVFGSHRFGALHLMATKRPRAGVSRIRLLNNIFVSNAEGSVNLPMKGPHAIDNRSDYNLYAGNQDYLLNPWGGLTPALVTESIARAVSRQTDRWLDAAPRLTLTEWQSVTGWDLYSKEVSISAAELTADLELTLQLMTDPSDVSAMYLPTVDRDFFGKPISRQATRAGPFQELHTGSNTLKVWPVVTTDTRSTIH